MNQVAPQNQNAPAAQQDGRFSTFMTSPLVKQKVQQIVGSKEGDRFVSSIVSAVSNNPALAECAPDSILSAGLVGQGLNLSPSPQLGHFYMVPFKNKKRCPTPQLKSWQYCKKCPHCMTAQFQIGYKGYIQLAIRSGQYKKLNVLAIKEGELLQYDPLFEEIHVNLIQDDTLREQTPTIGYYAMFEYLNGFRKTLYWSVQKMEAHADRYSQAFKLEDYRKLQAGQIPERDMWKFSSHWYSDFDMMAYKTMLRQIISKWGIMSIDLQQAMTNDMGVIGDDGTPEYVDASFASPSMQGAEAIPEETTDYSFLLSRMPEGTDPEMVKQFVVASAQTSGTVEADILAQAEADFDNFLPAFTAWVSPQKQPEPAPEPEPEKKPRVTQARREEVHALAVKAGCSDDRMTGWQQWSGKQCDEWEAWANTTIATTLQQEQQGHPQEQEEQSEKITCPNSKATVRVGIECAKCENREGCPEVN